MSPLAAVEAARIWHERFGVPLRIVAGSEKYSLAQPFYGPDRPSEFTHFRFEEAPWLTRSRIAREGLLSICVAGDQFCLNSARMYSHPGTIEIAANVQRTFAGMTGEPHALVYIMTPPRTAAAP